MSPIVRVLLIAGVLDIIVWILILAADETRSTIGKVVEREDEFVLQIWKKQIHWNNFKFYQRLCWLFISSWATFIIAEICLLEGSIMNAVHHPMDPVHHPEHARELLKESSSLFCETLIMDWAFTVAAIFTGLIYAFSALYYFFNISSEDDIGVPVTNV